MGKGDVVVECVSLFFFKNYSLVTCQNETYHCCATWCFWLVGDTSSSKVVVLDEGTLDKGNHFLNRMSK